MEEKFKNMKTGWKEKNEHFQILVMSMCIMRRGIEDGGDIFHRDAKKCNTVFTYERIDQI